MKNTRLPIPSDLQHTAQEIIERTDPFCAEHLDAEYAELCRKLVAKLARKRPSPLLRGELRTWAGAVIYTVGKINFLSDPTQRPHLTGDQLAHLTGVSMSTLSGKFKLIGELLHLHPLHPEFCRRELLEKNPMAWMISVNGFIVDARQMPPEIQAEARRKGLIPDLPTED